MRASAERRIGGTVHVNQRLERAVAHVVDVGIGGPQRMEARGRLAPLGLRDLVRFDEEKGGTGVDEPTNEPGRGGPVHADVPARHPLHTSPSLRHARRAPSAPSARRLTSSQSTFSMNASTYFAAAAP